jgi:hypothetical protein
MKVSEAIKTKTGFPYWIPESTRTELPQLFVELGFKVGVEVGVSWGQNMENYLKAGLKMYGVDPYLEYPDHPFHPINWFLRHKIPCRNMEDVYNYAMEHLGKYPNFTMVRKTSMDALADFPRKSIDFVYIDGNHLLGYAAMDLMQWSDKVKKHGAISGHDYGLEGRGKRQTRGVHYAVEAFAKCYDFNNWYAIGRGSAHWHEDYSRSFLFFKHW